MSKHNESYLWEKPKKPALRKRLWVNHRALAIAALFVLAPALMAAVTQIDLPTQAKGVLKIVNGGTGTASTLVGLIRGNATAMTAAELSGDVTTSGSNAATVVKINGTTITTNSAADQTIITTASATAVYKTLPDCDNGALAYDTTTHAFSCASVLTGTFADNETPSGTVNGSNDTFTLAQTPSPAGSLVLFKNGQRMKAAGADYTLTTNSIVFATAAIPVTGDVLIADYRY